MSYARLGCDGSNVYVYLDVNGYFVCCFCSLHGRYEASRTALMIEHLEEHRRLGQCVPQETMDDLVADAEDNDAWLAGLSDG